MKFTKEHLQNLAKDVLIMAKQNGATQAAVDLGVSDGLAIKVRLGEVESLEQSCDTTLGVSVYFGKKNGVATTCDFTKEGLQKAVKAACDIAKYTAADEYAGLAKENLLTTEFRDLDLYHPWNISVDEAIAKAADCEQLAIGSDKLITNSEGVDLHSGTGLYVYGNSHGFMGAQLNTSHSLTCILIAEVDGKMQRDGSYSVARDPMALWDNETIAKDAIKRTIAKLGARAIKTAKVPVLFAPDVATGLIDSLLSAISGGSLYRKSSFMLNQLGNKVFPDFVKISEDPFVLKGLASKSYDAEGVGVKPRNIIDNGILQGYLLGSYSARKLGMESTGNAGGSHNILVSNNDLNFAQMLQKLNTGLLVCDVMGQGVNITTGDYSRGATGFWVENGQIQYPVEEVTIAGNMADMFKNIVAIGNDLETRGKIHCGSILVEQMTVGGR